jgi:dihydroxyacetone kinase
MKKLLNDPRDTVREMLEGQVDLNPGQALLADENVVLRADLPLPSERTEVAVLSGGGSGHEPAHAGYVGKGMLHAAVAGDVFTSPSVDAVLAAIRAAAGPRGALLIVKNYTGDRLNFGLAAELARVENIPAKVVVVADDVALRDTVEPARRRGIAGTVLVHKVAGAAAAAGLTLEEVAAEAQVAAKAIGTMGVALGASTVPAAGRPGFSLGEGEVELGLGIHGEQGVRRVPLQPADTLVDTMLDTIIADRGLRSGERVVLLVNGLGGTPPMELAVVARRALAVLRDRGLQVERAWCGNFLTALEMPGMSLSVMQVNDARLAWLDAPAAAPAWPGNGRIAAERKIIASLPRMNTAPARTTTPAGARYCVRPYSPQQPHWKLLSLGSLNWTALPGMVTWASACRVVRRPFATFPRQCGPKRLKLWRRMGEVLRRAIAGSSGPFYATALLRAARSLPVAPTAADWSRAFTSAVDAIAELGGAKPGDRTMLDALRPAADSFSAVLGAGKSSIDAWKHAVEAARKGAEATASMHPRLGRASYLGARALGSPDAGAAAVVVWLEAITSSVAQSLASSGKE